MEIPILLLKESLSQTIQQRKNLVFVPYKNKREFDFIEKQKITLDANIKQIKEAISVLENVKKPAFNPN
jgi:5-methylcytosine-specific restriction endonuclease McrBC GTP-binding regulatory subunit McrB